MDVRPEDSKALVMLIEDDPGTRELFGIVLEVEGFAVIAFETAEEALAGLGSQRPAAVITDLSLAGEMSGIELARELRARRDTSEVELFAITGWDLKHLTADDEALFRRVFVKPIDVNEVSEAVRASVRRTQ